MTERDAYNMLLERADGDPHKALHLAVRWVAINGILISAGFVRSCPYGKVEAPEESPEPLDA